MAPWLMVTALLIAQAEPPQPDSLALARQIDRRINARMEAEQVVPTDRASDAEFLRRLSLDLIGRIPTAGEVRVFLEDSRPDKRERHIEQLLSDPAHARHFARVWRALMLPEAESEPQLRYFLPGFEAWLEQRRRENAGFDTVVRELLTPPIAAPGESPQFVLRDLRKPNPLAFIAAKNAEPAKIASSSVRLFLGLRIECAQCHDHPFDHWTRKQFWNQAAFFAGIERRGMGPFAPLVETAERKSISLDNTPETVEARFLDLSQPQFVERESARGRFAEWMTSPQNPYFARAVVNRVWSQFMGMGLVEPVDDFRDANTASHPELLSELSDAFVASGFDLTFLTRAICLSEAYQRTSRQNDPGQGRPELFARMAVRPLSGEQFFDSLTQAIGYEQPEASDREDGDEDPVRRRVLNLFSGETTTGDPETSVAQALSLMNGSVIQKAVTLDSGRRLKQIVEEFPDAPRKQIESLYLAALGRFPTEEEAQTLEEFARQGEPAAASQRMGDVFWALLNSPEFRWNH